MEFSMGDDGVIGAARRDGAARFVGRGARPAFDGAPEELDGSLLGVGSGGAEKRDAHGMFGGAARGDDLAEYRSDGGGG